MLGCCSIWANALEIGIPETKPNQLNTAPDEKMNKHNRIEATGNCQTESILGIILGFGWFPLSLPNNQINGNPIHKNT